MEGVNRIEGSNVAPPPDVVARIVKVCADFPTLTREQLLDQIGEEDAQKLREAVQTITSQTAVKQFIDKIFEEMFTQCVSGEQAQVLQYLFGSLQIIPPECLIKGEVGGVEGIKVLCAKLTEAAEKISAVSSQVFEESLKDFYNNSNSKKYKVEMDEEAFQNLCARSNKCLEECQNFNASFNEYEEASKMWLNKSSGRR